jgi:hypothetical protein
MKLKNILSEVKLIKQIPIYDNIDYDDSYHLYINNKVYNTYRSVMDKNHYIIYGDTYDNMDKVQSFLNKYKIPYKFEEGYNFEESKIRVEKIYFKII